MDDFIPKFIVISYYAIINDCIIRFCEDFNTSFVSDSGIFVFSKNISRQKLKKYFKTLILEWLKKNTSPFDIIHPRYHFIINNCNPKNNIILDVKDDNYFPKKLEKIINSEFPIEFCLKEKDIKIDLILFNSIFKEIFEEYFEKPERITKEFGKNYKNLFFIQHKRLDYVAFKKIFRHIFGRNNVIKKQINPENEKLININILLNTYIRNKRILNQSGELKLIVTEIKNYVSELLENINGKE